MSVSIFGVVTKREEKCTYGLDTKVGATGVVSGGMVTEQDDVRFPTRYRTAVLEAIGICA